MSDRYVVVRCEFPDCPDHKATKYGDQLRDFAAAVGENASIIAEGIVGDPDDPTSRTTPEWSEVQGG